MRGLAFSGGRTPVAVAMIAAAVVLPACDAWVEPGPQRQTLVGTWEVAEVSSAAAGQIQFHSNGSWTGTDGCNRLVGEYSVDEGQFTSSPDVPNVAVECVPPGTDLHSLLASSTRVEVTETRATFLSGTGAEVLVLTRQ